MRLIASGTDTMGLCQLELCKEGEVADCFADLAEMHAELMEDITDDLDKAIKLIKRIDTDGLYVDEEVRDWVAAESIRRAKGITKPPEDGWYWAYGESGALLGAVKVWSDKHGVQWVDSREGVSTFRPVSKFKGSFGDRLPDPPEEGR